MLQEKEYFAEMSEEKRTRNEGRWEKGGGGGGEGGGGGVEGRKVHEAKHKRDTTGDACRGATTSRINVSHLDYDKVKAQPRVSR